MSNYIIAMIKENDRIEELVAICEELEARLEKAVETLKYYNVAGYEGKEARTTLAELKGQNDE